MPEPASSTPTLLPPPLAGALASFAIRRPARAGSLVITLFGDAILPRGGAAALEGLRRALTPFGVNDSQLRTAVSRLVADGWLVGQRTGATRRGAVYALTADGRARAEEATRRIYAPPPRAWNRTWTLAVLSGDGAVREDLRRRLGWLGFGTLAPNLLIDPAPDAAALASALADLPAAARPLIVVGPALAGGDGRALAARAWNLDALGAAWRGFADGFGPLAAAFARGAPDPFAALLARVLLIHEYRRILLRDPRLPPALLPPAWPGIAAHALVAGLYRRLAWQAEAWIDAAVTGPAGRLPPPGPGFAARFGGLGRRPGVSQKKD